MEDVIDRQSYIDKLIEIEKTQCTEIGHVMADDILCEILEKLGYNDILEKYYNIGKWYS